MNLDDAGTWAIFAIDDVGHYHYGADYGEGRFISAMLIGTETAPPPSIDLATVLTIFDNPEITIFSKSDQTYSFDTGYSELLEIMWQHRPTVFPDHTTAWSVSSIAEGCIWNCVYPLTKED